jgi:hypothetical protein
VFICAVAGKLRAQEHKSLYDKLYNLPDKVFNGMDKKTNEITSKLVDQTEKYLNRLEREEKRLQKKMAKKDSIGAAKTFGDIEQKYAQLRQKLHNKSATALAIGSRYSPYVDSLKTSLAFLNKLETNSADVQKKLDGALAKYQSLQSSLNGVEDIRKYLKERETELRTQFEKLGMMKELDHFKKEVYYYRAQMDEYRHMLDDPTKAEATLLNYAKKIPKFQSFFSKYSDLAQLFPQPDGFGTTASLAGLQTRASIQQFIQDRLGSAGPNALPMIQGNVQQAQNELTTLKNKINETGAKNSDADMPDFKPNSQRTKSFLQRIELGTNLQTVKTNGFYPATSDIGLSLGYKLNDRSVVGVGGSYKVGLGSINHVQVSSEGMSLRSFIDFKIKGSIWLSGGGEMNYHNRFNDFTILNNYTAWQRSALLGLSKKYAIGKKAKGNVQVLYDFLHAQNVPQTQAVVFRFGYNFK